MYFSCVQCGALVSSYFSEIWKLVQEEVVSVLTVPGLVDNVKKVFVLTLTLSTQYKSSN